MTSDETVVVARTEYDALIDRNEELEDRLAALNADDGSRVPHEVALAIIRGKSPVLAFRNHLGVTLRELSDRTGIAASYLSEIERGRKPGSASALDQIADALGTTIDALGTHQFYVPAITLKVRNVEAKEPVFTMRQHGRHDVGVMNLPASYGNVAAQ